jgi:uncharacterized membrane protein required for colicin V production
MAFAPVDFLVMAIFGLAVTRGLLRGLLRESFSIASLAAAVISVRLFSDDIARWLLQISGGQVGELAAPWIAGFLIVLTAIGITTAAGRLLRRSAKAAGLGWADRAGGLLMGTAEGVLVAGIILSVGIYFFGRSHEILANSRSLEAMDQLEEIARSGEIDLDQFNLPSVAAPPPDTESD